MKLARAEKTYGPAKCAWCDGSKKWQVAPGTIASCIVCGGKGYVSMVQPAGHCRECSGRGRRQNLNPCLTCAGTGWEHISGLE
jgi:hypothetical protein